MGRLFWKKVLPFLLVICMVFTNSGMSVLAQENGSLPETKTEAADAKNDVEKKERKVESTTEKKVEVTTEKKEEATTEKKVEVTTEKKEEATTEKKVEATTEKKEEATTEKKVEAATEKKEAVTTEEKVETTTEKNEVTEEKKEEKATEATTALDKAEETSTEVKEEAILSSKVTKSVLWVTADDGTVSVRIAHILKVKNSGKADSKDSVIKALLSANEEFVKKENNTINYTYVADRTNPPAGVDFNEATAGDLNGFTGKEAVVWKKQSVKAGAENTYVFYTDVKGDAKKESLKELYYVDGTKVNSTDIKWENEDKLVSPAEVKEFTYEDSNVSMKITVPEGVTLPEGAALVVKPYEENSKEYKKAEKKINDFSKENIVKHMIYDISFMKDNQEVEPQGGDVSVSFTFKKPVKKETAALDQYEVAVCHIKDNGKVEDIKAESEVSESGKLESVEFVSDSFSEYDIMLLSSNPTTTDTITGDAYNLYYLLNHFQAVALEGDLKLDIHCMGPVLAAGNLKGNGSGFGDSEYTDVSSYIGGYVDYRGPNNSRQKTEAHNLYVGTSNTVTNNYKDLNGIPNFNKGPQGATVHGDIYTTDNYVDWNRMKSAVSGMVELIGGLANQTIEAKDDWQEISVPSGSVVNLKTNGKKVKINIIGDSLSTTVINVIDGGSVLAPQIKERDGIKNAEDHRSGMPLMMTFPNATTVNVISDLSPEIGQIVAPNAHIDINNCNYNGCMIGKSIYASGEGHLWPFKGGEIISASSEFTVTKTVDGETPNVNSFKFTVSELKNGTWQVIDTKNNNGSDVKFNSIAYNEPGDHWYLVQEDQTPINGYKLSSEKYLLKVSVSAGQSGSLDVNLSSNVTIYKANNGVSVDELLRGGNVDTSKISLVNVSSGQTSADVVKFDNKTTGSLELSKAFNGIEANSLTDAQKKAIQFTITGLDNYSKTVKYSEFTNGKYTLNGLPIGEYTVTETGLPSVENMQSTVTINGVDATSATVTVTKGGKATAAISNTYTSSVGSLKLVKNFTGATLTEAQKNQISFTITGPNNYSKTVNYSEFTDGSHTITGLKPGKYTIEENGANLTGYDWSMEVEFDKADAGAAKVVAGEVTTATFGNDYEQHVGNLKLTKAFSGINAADLTAEQKAAIQFTITGPNDYSKTVSYSEFTNGEYTESGLPVGEYTVTEIGLPSVENMQATVTINGTDTTSATVPVTKNKTATAAISNTYTSTVGSLKLVKNFTGATLTEAQKNQISFTITGPDNYSKTVNYSEFTDGSHTITGLQPGSYTIKENGAALTGYTWTMKVSVDKAENNVPVVKAGEVTTATFGNNYEQHVGNLKLTKAFSGINAADLTAEQKAAIQFTITGPNDYSKTVSYSEFTNGEYTESGLPVGEYTVTETGLPSVENMQATVTINSTNDTSAKVTVTKDNTATAAISNKYTSSVGSLKLVKNFTGAPLTEAQKNEVSFVITGPNDYRNEVKYSEFTNGSYTITGLQPGSYTIEESGADLTGYTWSMEATIDKAENNVPVVVAGEVTTATFGNNYEQHVGNLKLTKAFSGINAADLTAEQKAAIQFTITGPNDYSKTVSYSEFTNGEYTESGLPVGEYTVTETGLPSVENMQATVAINSTNDTSAKVTVTKDNTATAAISNTYTSTVGSLKIVKNFTGAPLTEAQKNEVSFVITGPNDYRNEVKYSEFTNGSYTITGLQPGSYTIEESGADLTGYTWSMEATIDKAENNVPVVVAGEVTTATFGNNYTQLVGKLELSKTFAGAELTEAQKNQISFSITGPNNYSQIISYSEFTNGKYTIESLPIGDYTVTEQNAAIDGYTVTTTYTKSSGIEAKIINKIKAAMDQVDENIVVAIQNGQTSTVTIGNTYTRNTYPVKISKTDINGTKEIAGAELKVTDKDGKEVTSWTSVEDKSHEVTLQPGRYTLTETTAPKGYKVAESITFEVDKTGKVQIITVDENDEEIATDAANSKVVMKDDYADGKVIIKKTDIAGKEIAGAVLKVVKGDNADGTDVVDTWTSVADKSHEVTLQPGTYTLTETTTPKGYEQAESITFTVDKDNKVTVAGKEVGSVVMVDAYSDQKVTISKVDVGGKEIAGAQITVTKKGEDGKDVVVDKWTSEEGKSHDITVKPGEYTFHEVNAPEGYEAVTDITFTVDKDGKVTVTGTETNAAKVDKDGKLVITDKYSDQKVTISKVDVGGKEIAGAEITVTKKDKDGKDVVVEEWTSEAGKNHDITVKPGEYTFHEVNAPKGYEAVTDITFTVDKDGKVTVTGTETNAAKVDKDGKLVITDKYSDQTVTISKTDINGTKELAGAELKVTDKDGKEVTSWTSVEDKSHEVKLQPGRYTLTETTAPKGYKVAESITFEVDKTGKVQIITVDENNEEIATDAANSKVVMKDAYADGKVIIKKTDIAGKEIAGAVLKVVKGDNADGTDVVDTWTSVADKSHEVTLQPGTYTLTETTTPKGYEQAESITFTVDKDNKVTVAGKEVGSVVMVDAYSDQKVTISKVDVGGKEIAGAQITVTKKGEDGKDVVVDKWTSEEGKSHDITVKPGEYTFHEVYSRQRRQSNCNRYRDKCS